MRRIYLVVEGQTEQEFVREILMPYFRQHEIYDVRAILLETSEGHKGGFVSYAHLKKLVVRLLKEEPDVVVSTLVDFFRIPTNLPGYNDCMKIMVTPEKIDCLQKHISEDIGQTIKSALFIPYIQQYEFESLLFASGNGVAYGYDAKVLEKVLAIINQFPNPEDINGHPATAPSKRLLDILPDYQKVVDGNIIALEIGAESILEKCPRFRAWIESLLSTAQN